ncbi:MAG: 30S ribosomal protein S15 [Halobacteriovoraceae bacterium]|nr:30S ribosomal protein S15 [Halobacteriovoraceae bacterium]MBC98410.1 30S ribosomal protein S15 [Halobacteriovoraceae bacterium]|tara:strand:+ start:69789 stop:70067 length:279 start_codon:yes stop_codon:yes gene_type:complete
MITTERTQELVKTFGAKFGSGEKDTGCTAVQVAILTERINNLKGHFAANKHDYHSNRGLLKMIGRRRSLLKYLRTNSEESYKSLIKDLGLRK